MLIKISPFLFFSPIGKINTEVSSWTIPYNFYVLDKFLNTVGLSEIIHPVAHSGYVNLDPCYKVDLSF